LSALLLSTALVGCGGSGNSGGGSAGGGVNPPPADTTPPLSASTFNLAYTAVKTFRFTWSSVADANFYRLLENPDGLSGFVQVGSDIPQGTLSTDHVVPLHQRINARYLLQSCNSAGCTDGDTVLVSGTLADAVGYFKASNTAAGDQFGFGVALSGDGMTLAVGAPTEDSFATGIDGDRSDDSAGSAGAVYVFTRSGNSWDQQAYVKASNTLSLAWFGRALALNSDGTTLAVGADGEASLATGIGIGIGIGGDQTDDAGFLLEPGAVYLY
jgi:hypothetical protein